MAQRYVAHVRFLGISSNTIQNKALDSIKTEGGSKAPSVATSSRASSVVSRGSSPAPVPASKSKAKTAGKGKKK